ncbi:Hypothetical protein PBC10988_33180 [Planctomycetales bacterium 10988]|nr:Hypothetical protein PBC10988_33180 [Planctomycetales bacterium 10988]
MSENQSAESTTSPEPKTETKAPTLGILQTAGWMAILFLLFDLAFVWQWGFSIGRLVVAMAIGAVTGAWWTFSQYLGQLPLKGWSLLNVLARSWFFLWVIGVMLGSWLVIPQGPGNFEVPRVLGISFLCMILPVGILALVLEALSLVGKYEFPAIPEEANPAEK